jgi:hypothetical protein
MEACGPGQPGQNVRPFLHTNQSKKGLEGCQEVECLPNKCEALTSNPLLPK